MLSLQEEVFWFRSKQQTKFDTTISITILWNSLHSEYRQEKRTELWKARICSPECVKTRRLYLKRFDHLWIKSVTPNDERIYKEWEKKTVTNKSDNSDRLCNTLDGIPTNRSSWVSSLWVKLWIIWVHETD